MQERPDISLYDWLTSHDILGWLKPLWEQGGWRLREDGKLAFDQHAIAINTPWVHVKNDWRLDCSLWHRLIFDYVSQRQPDGSKFVPSRCQECWKTVVRPQNLKQLFALEDLQRRLNRPSKCGIEVRETVPALYGGYFYAVGFHEGCVRYNEVRQAVNEDPLLGPDVPVILKRACTEFEIACGPSTQWTVSPQQLEIEAMFEKYIAKDNWYRAQPEILIWYVHKKWIEWAAAHGDKSYLEFTNDKPIVKPYDTYHHIAEDPDFPNNIISKPLTPSVSPPDGEAGAEEVLEEKEE